MRAANAIIASLNWIINFTIPDQTLMKIHNQFVTYFTRNNDNIVHVESKILVSAMILLNYLVD